MTANQLQSYIYEPVDNGYTSHELVQVPGVIERNLRASGNDSETDLLSHSTPTPFAITSTPEDTVAKRKWWHFSQFSGWRVSVTWCTIATTIVLLINTVWTIWAAKTYGTQGGRGIMFNGSCKKSKSLTLGLHLVINFLGTVLLAASNYCMQCLASPTRDELDEAHSKGRSLDIGVPSLKNILGIRKERRVLWLLLVLSGIPLHLLFNSAVFSTLSATEYTQSEISEELATSPDVDIRKEITTGLQDFFALDPDYGYDQVIMDTLVGFRSWERLENLDCMQAYAPDYLSNRGHVMLVTSKRNTSSPIRPVGYTGQNGADGREAWMCMNYPETQGHGPSACDIDKLRKYASTWTVVSNEMIDNHTCCIEEEARVEYCLSERKEEHCTVQFDLPIMIVVIVANAVKVMAMLLTLWTQRHDPLVTLGDAIKSFLKTSDSTTSNMCLAGRKDFPRGHWPQSPKTWHGHRPPRWFQGASKWRWFICNVLCILALIACIILLKIGFTNPYLLSKSPTHLWKLGFGAPNHESLITGYILTVPQAVLTANSPQLLLTFLFLTYNSLYTCMLMTQEWFDYAYDRKPLRVTDRVGAQRSTYRLQLPYKYGIPMIIVGTVLHWLLSQSIFLVVVQYYDDTGLINAGPSFDGVHARLGYSIMAIIITIIVGGVTIIVGFLMGCRRYRGGMPLVGSCSAAISAACHRPKEDVDAAELPLMWGVVEEGATVTEYHHDEADEQAVGHCCFTSLPVSQPVEGRTYAGQGSLEEPLQL